MRGDLTTRSDQLITFETTSDVASDVACDISVDIACELADRRARAEP